MPYTLFQYGFKLKHETVKPHSIKKNASEPQNHAEETMHAARHAKMSKKNRVIIGFFYP